MGAAAELRNPAPSSRFISSSAATAASLQPKKLFNNVQPKKLPADTNTINTTTVAKKKVLRQQHSFPNGIAVESLNKLTPLNADSPKATTPVNPDIVTKTADSTKAADLTKGNGNVGNGGRVVRSRDQVLSGPPGRTRSGTATASVTRSPSPAAVRRSPSPSVRAVSCPGSPQRRRPTAANSRPVSTERRRRAAASPPSSVTPGDASATAPPPPTTTTTTGVKTKTLERRHSVGGSTAKTGVTTSTASAKTLERRHSARSLDGLWPSSNPTPPSPTSTPSPLAVVNGKRIPTLRSKSDLSLQKTGLISVRPVKTNPVAKTALTSEQRRAMLLRQNSDPVLRSTTRSSGSSMMSSIGSGRQSESINGRRSDGSSFDLALRRQGSLGRVSSVILSGRYGLSATSPSSSSTSSPKLNVPKPSLAIAGRSLSGGVRLPYGTSRLKDDLESASSPASTHRNLLDESASDGESTCSSGSSVVNKGPTRGTTVPVRFFEDMISRLQGRPVCPTKDHNGTKSTTTATTTTTTTTPTLDVVTTTQPTTITTTPTETITADATLPKRPKNPNAVNTSSALPLANSAWPSSPGRLSCGTSTPQTPSSPSASSCSSSNSIPQLINKPADSFSPTPARGAASPTRSRVFNNMQQSTMSLNMSFIGHSTNIAHLLNYGMDARKGRNVLNQLEEAHELRILHNRWIQWRFMNARAETAMNTQREFAEKYLYNVGEGILDLKASVSNKQVQLQKERHDLKLDTVLSLQVPCLDTWQPIQEEHLSSVQGLLEALEAANVGVPIVGGVKVDMEALKSALGSTTDVMQALDTSVNKLLSKVEVTNSSMSELAKAIVQERSYLEDFRELLVHATSLEVEERSLRTQLMQLDQKSATSARKQ